MLFLWLQSCADTMVGACEEPCVCEAAVCVWYLPPLLHEQTGNAECESERTRFSPSHHRLTAESYLFPPYSPPVLALISTLPRKTFHFSIDSIFFSWGSWSWLHRLLLLSFWPHLKLVNRRCWSWRITSVYCSWNKKTLSWKMLKCSMDFGELWIWYLLFILIYWIFASSDYKQLFACSCSCLAAVSCL